MTIEIRKAVLFVLLLIISVVGVAFLSTILKDISISGVSLFMIVLFLFVAFVVVGVGQMVSNSKRVKN